MRMENMTKKSIKVAAAILIVVLVYWSGRLSSVGQDEGAPNFTGSPCDGSAVMSRGESFLRNGKLSKAGLYFSRAMTCDPGNIELVEKYAHSIHSYVDSMKDREKAVALLADLELFLRNQAQHVPPRELDSLAKLIDEVAHKRKEALDKTGELVITQRGDFVELETFAQKMLDELDKQADKVGQDDASLMMYRLSVAEGVLQKMVLISESSADGQRKAGVREKIDRFNGIKARVGKSLSKEKYEELKNLYSRLDDSSSIGSNHAPQGCKKPGRYQTRLDARKDFSQRALRLISEITDSDYQDKALKILEGNNYEMENLRDKQGKAYVNLAINRMRNFHDVYKEAKGRFGTNNRQIYNAMLSLLAAIDTRLIGQNASVAYNELFRLAYEELDEEQKVKIGFEMAKRPKKSLCAF